MVVVVDLLRKVQSLEPVVLRWAGRGPEAQDTTELEPTKVRVNVQLYCQVQLVY